MIIYTCPKCGGDIYHTCICTLPPIDVWACLDCDWRYEEKDGIEYRPFEPVKAKLVKIGQWRMNKYDKRKQS